MKALKSSNAKILIISGHQQSMVQRSLREAFLITPALMVVAD
jgi:hypothetical protein